jgi:hypothetical protein
MRSTTAAPRPCWVRSMGWFDTRTCSINRAAPARKSVSGQTSRETRTSVRACSAICTSGSTATRTEFGTGEKAGELDTILRGARV